MKTTSTSILLLLFVGFAFNTFSQEWKWRNEYWVEKRELQDSDFELTEFSDSADFRSTLFRSIANFKEAKFSSFVDFTSSEFYKDAEFNYANFASTTEFSSATFESTVEFKHAQFDSIVEFRHTRFNSIADFTATRFFSEAIFTQAKFPSLVYFGEAVFDSKAVFLSVKFDSASFVVAQFSSTADFNRARFSSIAYFEGAKFTSTADFMKTKFSSIANFMEAKFSSTSFYKAKFSSIVYFYAAQFDSLVNFDQVQFDSTAYFVQATFSSIADFKEAKFSSIAVFNKARFKSGVFFSRARFDSLLVFTEAEFHGEIDFTGTTLPKYLNFSLVTEIASEIELTKTLSNSKYEVCYINLTDAAVEKFRFRYNRFKLWFPEEDSAGYELKASVYEDLLTKQQEEGFTQSFQKLDKEYREFQYTDPGAGRGIWGQLLNWVDKNWWGYGYDKELIIRNVFIIFLIISLLNSFFLKYLTTNVYANEKIEHLLKSKKNKNWLNKWFDSLRYSVFYTAVIFFSFNFDMEKLNYAGNLDGWRILNLTYFMIVYLGGVVCMAYLANFIITV